MEDRIDFSIEIKADIIKVWEQWTTQNGLQSFLASVVYVDPVPGGVFEVWFDPDAPEGSRGSEGMKIAALEMNRMLSFTWNAPPSIPEIRKQMTLVSVSLTERMSGKGAPVTGVRLQNGFYGSSEEWREAYDYFYRAWGGIVLPRLKYSLEVCPIDWENPQDTDKYRLDLS